MKLDSGGPVNACACAVNMDLGAGGGISLVALNAAAVADGLAAGGTHAWAEADAEAGTYAVAITGGCVDPGVNTDAEAV